MMTVSWEISFLKILSESMGPWLLLTSRVSTAQGGTKAPVYRRIAAKLSEGAGSGGIKDVAAIKARQRRLQSHWWKPMRALVDLSGFGWNASRNIVEAEEEVSDRYIEVCTLSIPPSGPSLARAVTSSFEIAHPTM